MTERRETKAAAWADPDRWRTLVDGSACPICRHGRPWDSIAEFDSLWVTAPTTAQLPGYACVVAKRHVVEPFEFDDDEAHVFWCEAMTVARRLAGFTGAVKMNYGIHGNLLPHVHMHLWPRYPDDPYDVGGIPAHGASFTRTPQQLRAMGDAVQALASTGEEGCS